MLLKGLGILIVFVALIAGLIFGRESLLPPEFKGVRMVVSETNNFIKIRTPQIENKTFKKKEQYTDKNGDINPIKFFGVAMTAADDVRDDRRIRAAAIARAKDEDEFIPQAVVQGHWTDWTTVAEIRVPTRITVSPEDKITPIFRPTEKSNADGIHADMTKHGFDQTVLMKERSDLHLPMIGTGNVGELIGKLSYDNSGHSLGFPMGTDSVLCVGPGFHDGGRLTAMANGWAVVSQVPMSLELGNTNGEYRLTITPDKPELGQTFATEVCKAHPSALVVRHPRKANPGVILVAQQ